MRAVCAVLLLVGVGAFAPQANAQDDADTTLSACVARVVAQARSEGAKPYAQPIVDFMLSQEQRAYSYRLPLNGCFGFAALGHRRVQHLGLTLYAPSGRVLAQSQSRQAFAYARFCGEAGRSFVVETRMLDGEGEVHLIPLWDGPEQFQHTLEATVDRCVELGTPRPQPVDVGPEPLGPPLESELVAVSRRLSTQGYQIEAGMLFGTLRQQRHEVRRVVLDASHCYALAAVGDVNVEDIDLRLLALTSPPVLVASDITRQRDAVVKVCPRQSGAFLLDVRMYRGGGNYVVHSFRLAEPASRHDAGVEDGTRIPYAETVAEFARLGMATEPLTWGLLQPGDAQTIPLQLSAGRCYAIAAIASPDFAGADLDMSLVDEQGRFAAAEQGPGPHPKVFHCPQQSALYKAVLRGQDVRQPSRFLLLLGADSPPREARL